MGENDIAKQNTHLFPNCVRCTVVLPKKPTQLANNGGKFQRMKPNLKKENNPMQKTQHKKKVSQVLPRAGVALLLASRHGDRVKFSHRKPCLFREKKNA